MTIHIIPVKDLKEHIEKTICWCEPKIKIVNGDMIITHNSADGREYLEQVKDILNERNR